MIRKAATNVFRPVRLRTDVGVPGCLWLRLAGDAGAFRIWTTNALTPANAPLLVCGQAVTNGAGGVAFLTGADTDLYVEAVSNGTAKLTYGFTGTGDAAGLRCAAALGMTAVRPDIVLKNDYSNLPISPVFDGALGRKWVVATFPEPQQTNIVFSVRLLGIGDGSARLKYHRGNQAEAEIQWDGETHDLSFVDGWLNADIRLNDGPGITPTMTLTSGVVTVSGVQQGDKIIVEETTLGCRDEIGVIKNFSWNDLQRLGVNNLTMHPDFDSLLPEIKRAIKETVVFCLDASSSRSQKAQLTNDMFRSSGLYAVEYTNFISLHPDLLVLDIPSTRSIGRFPDDSDHFHLGLETASIPFVLANKRTSLRNARDPAYENGFEAFQDSTVSLLVDLINSTYDYPSSISFLMFHTYEDTTTFAINYLSSEASEYLCPGDPTRNLRWSFIAEASPQLTYPGQENDADWMNGIDPPVDLCQIQFFVTRKGEIVLLGTDGYELVVQGLISDALEVQ